MYIICIHLVNPTMSSMELWRELNVMIQEQNLEEHHIMKWGSAEDFCDFPFVYYCNYTT